MPRESKTFRIFVSSTFSDLKEERNALQEKVFPKLRDLCMQYSCRFQAIDLRWGISREATHDQQTMNICLQELKRCQKITPKPNFIVLLGDRYGWCPLPPQIEVEEFEAILGKVSQEERDLLLWDEKQPYDKKGWYRRDNNAVPSEYCLRPREVKFKDGSSDKKKKEAIEKESNEWEKTEKKLQSIILSAIDRLGWSKDDPHRVKYEASATHQEILNGALSVPDANEHVYCFFRKIENLPQEPTTKDFIDIDEKGRLDSKAQQKLQSLKKNLHSNLSGNIFKYKVRWKKNTITITTDYLKKLCDDVYNSLSKVIIEQAAAFEKADKLETEINNHKSFGMERAKFFTGRTTILKTISDYIKGTDTHPLAILGESGSGKTALMAYAAKRAQEANPEAKVIFRYIGATPPSSDGRTLLEGLCRQIYEVFEFEKQKKQELAETKGIDEEAQKKRKDIEEKYVIPPDFQKLSVTFSDFLVKIPTGSKLILFLDALNQLSDADNARDLSWLPPELPKNVHLIVSSLPRECLSILKKKLPLQNLIKLEPMTSDEGQKLLNLWLQDVGRTLQDHQQKELLSKFDQCGLPLYLKLAFEEARNWKSYTEKIKLSQDIPGLICDLFRRLSLDTNHGNIMVSRSLGYLAAAKNGLSEDELLDILSLDKEVLDDFTKHAYHKPPQERLPVVVWSRLYFDLEPYLTERAADGTSLMTFYHPQFGRVVVEEFLEDQVKKKRHQTIAQYFGPQSLWTEKEGKRNPNVRKVSELPYQQTYGEIWDEVERTLCDLFFIEAKCAAEMTYDLIADYNITLDALPESQEEKEKRIKYEKRIRKYTEDLIAYSRRETRHLAIIPSVELWSEEKIEKDTERIVDNPTRLDRIRAFSQFVSSEGYALVKFAFYPGFCVQQAYNSASSGPVAIAAENIINSKIDDLLILQLPSQRPDYNPHPALIKILEGHTGSVSSVSIAPDGKRAISGSDGSDGSDDKTLRVWDLESGKCLKTFGGNTGWIICVSITPDGRRAVSGSLDRNLRVWDLEGGKCLKILKGHTGWVFSVGITPDGKRSVSAGGSDRTLRVWDLEGGKCLKILKGHTDWVSSVSITPDGRRAVSGSHDKTLRVWDLESGKCLKILKGHTDHLDSISITLNGKKAVSGGLDGTLRVWDIESGKCLKIFEEIGSVESISITSDGRIAVSGSWDNTLRVWDLEGGKCLKIFEGHTGYVNSVNITPDGKRAVSGSNDKTLRVWDIESGKCLKIVERHTGSVSSVSITPDGGRAVSGGEDDTLRVWDLESGKCLKILKGNKGWITCVSITPDGKRSVSAGGSDRTLQVWDLESGKCLKILKGHTGWVSSVSITPDGRRAVSGSWDNTLRVWDLESGKCLKIFEGHTDEINSVSITPDGKRAVSGSNDKTLRVWDLESGKCLKTLRWNTDWITCVSIAPDGKRAISGSDESDDKTLRVWDLESGKCLKILKGHTGWIYSVGITPDGRRAVSGSSDRTLRVWDLESGRCLIVYQSSSLVDSVSDIRASGNFVFGTTIGEVIVIIPQNFPTKPPIVTPIRIRLYGNKTWLFRNNEHWEDDIKVSCQWCGQRFPVSYEILNIIKAIARDNNLSLDQSPCLTLPMEAWDDPRLLSECPLCHNPLRFNPFIVDNKGRY